MYSIIALCGDSIYPFLQSDKTALEINSACEAAFYCYPNRCGSHYTSVEKQHLKPSGQSEVPRWPLRPHRDETDPSFDMRPGTKRLESFQTCSGKHFETGSAPTVGHEETQTEPRRMVDWWMGTGVFCRGHPHWPLTATQSHPTPRTRHREAKLRFRYRACVVASSSRN